MYELHIYTMGTRAYAMNIAKIVDPTKKIFGDRIISRDENGSMIQKNLRRLFWDSKMVAIIDDRADVWPQDRPNLIKVVPYDFFLGIGDINSSFLPKLEGPPKIAPALKRKHSAKDDVEEVEPEKVETPDGEKAKDESTNDVKPTAETPASNGNPVVAKEELVRSGGSDDQALKLEQATDEQEKFLEKQLIERPLLHMQEELDKEDVEEDTTTPESKNGDSTQPHPHHRHNLLKDDDVELMYLEKHLSQLHKAFYDDYDRALVSAHGGRVAQLKPGHNKKVSLKSESADLKIVPDVGQVMPRIK
jgi:RNA polymerase II subunit A-like phosphatase